MRFDTINLSKLPSPDVVEPLDYEQILLGLKQDLQGRNPDFITLLESDPAVKLLEVVAYRELILRQRINDAARSVMLAYAVGDDLDHLAALFSVARQVIDPGDPNSVPPIAPTYESDDRFRERVQLNLEGHSTAGPIGSYMFHALSADPQVKDVDIDSPSPGEVVVTVLSTIADGVSDQALLDIVYSALNAESVRPLTDHVTVQSAAIVPYTIEAELTLYYGPDDSVVMSAAEKALQDYVDTHHRLGHDIALSGLYAALHQPGVQHVLLNMPSMDIEVASSEAAYCTDINLVLAGRDE